MNDDSVKCLAVAFAIADRRAAAVTHIVAPDVVERSEAAVDLHCAIDGEAYAFEHSQLLSFRNQKWDDQKLMKVLAPLQDSLRGVLPLPGHYTLTIDTGVVCTVRDAKLVRAAVTAWVTARAGGLALGSPATAPAHRVREVPPGLSFEVTLARWDDDAAVSEVYVERFLPDDEHQQRRACVRKLLDDKLAKLMRQVGRRHILVVEITDRSMGSPGHAHRSLAAELRDRPGAPPDDVWLFDGRWDRWDTWQLGKRADEIGRRVVVERAAVEALWRSA